MTRVRRLTAAIAAALVGTVALSGCGFHGLYSANLPGGADVGSHPYDVTIYFRDVLDLVPQSAVKVNDVAVGKVVSIALSKQGDPTGDPSTVGWTAKVKVQVNGSVDLPANARAAVQMTSLLGEKYVSLEQPLGKGTGHLANGASIPVTSTDTAPEVEDVLGALSLLLNEGGIDQIKTITTELNNAFKGKAGTVRDLLAQLNTFVKALDNRKNDITNALDNINQLAATLSAQKKTIEATLDTLPIGLKILADDRKNLVKLLASLSNLGAVANNVINASQKTLVRSLTDLDPVLKSLNGASADIPNALLIAGTFPFPIGKTLQFVKGDYANLSLSLNLNLTDELCGVSSALCGLPSLSSASSSALATQSSSGSSLPGVSGG